MENSVDAVDQLLIFIICSMVLSCLIGIIYMYIGHKTIIFVINTFLRFPEQNDLDPQREDLHNAT